MLKIHLALRFDLIPAVCSGPMCTAAAVAVKLPPFWPEKAWFWFTIAEANFVTGRITDETTKFYHVVRQLDSETAGRLMDIIQNPPET